MGSLYWHILALAVWTQISGVFPKLCCRSCVEHCAGHDLLRGSGLTQKHVPVMSSEPFTCLKSLCAQTAAPKLRGQAGTCFTCAHMILNSEPRCSCHRGMIWHDAVMSLAGSSWLPFLSVETCFRSAPVATKNDIARGNARDRIQGP